MATKRKPAARKTTTKRRRSAAKRKARSQPFPYTINVIGAVIGALAVLGILNLGFLGMLVANLGRILVGETYQVLLVIVGAMGVALAFTGTIPVIKRRFIIGGAIAYVGWLLWLEATLFLSGNQHAHFWTVTWNRLANNLISGAQGLNVGGGMIGAGLLTVTSFLVAIAGSLVVAALLILLGVAIFMNLPLETLASQAKAGVQNLTKLVGRLVSGTVTGVQTAVAKQRDKRAQLAEKQPVAQPEKATQKPASKQTLVTPTEKELPTPVRERDSHQPKSEAEDYHITVASQTSAASEAPVVEEPILSGVGNDDDPNYQLPTTSLLTAIPKEDQTEEFNAIKNNTQVLRDTLASFGVDAEIKNVSLGPSVTEYELHPAVGVKVSKIVNLADDLALALAAKDIRIEAPIPGKSLIGIEVPNREVATVSFRDVFESAPKHPGQLLDVPLGRDVSGQVIMMDLTKMPHLLIAGSTGSGKSVAINGIISSILMQAKPNEVKLMLIDPKKVELSIYNGVPHLLTPVVSEPKKAAKALHKVVAEMEHRYELFAQCGQRKISGYNDYVKQENAKDNLARPTLPYIVVVVDELADLMMTVSSEVEDAIIRLAQMGRAAGIHMILATQRPSVDVITGLIKANVPSRIAFAVSSGIDSRTILDSNGAEKLLGRGDMLYLPIDQNSPVRVQGAFISDQDVTSIVDFIKSEETVHYDEDMIVTDEDISAEESSEDQDDLFDEALDFVIDQQKASTSLLQRRFRIGYNRAARIIDDLEQRGYIGPQEGSKPRQVYKAKPTEED
ncbi:DNA translocase FtsK [Levilactobacillus bambusae]|uniref:DNA translocase FtsK n=1 Tax=Levilactobacillus bambusae TaxID=2024736 RepID=A0A2V1N062_9LACO|nr:DNA translocase FtsK [Levilactobacillus bambusae]PWG00629.1 cell division protein FtsK [Levilactobacillus bambusae]